MQCLTIACADALEREIEGLDGDFDRLQSQPDHQLQAATRDRRADFEAATRGHPRQSELLNRVSAGDASRTLGVAREILADVRRRLAAGESPITTEATSVGAAASK